MALLGTSALEANAVQVASAAAAEVLIFQQSLHCCTNLQRHQPEHVHATARCACLSEGHMVMTAVGAARKHSCEVHAHMSVWLVAVEDMFRFSEHAGLQRADAQRADRCGAPGDLHSRAAHYRYTSRLLKPCRLLHGVGVDTFA